MLKKLISKFYFDKTEKSWQFPLGWITLVICLMYMTIYAFQLHLLHWIFVGYLLWSLYVILPTFNKTSNELMYDGLFYNLSTLITIAFFIWGVDGGWI